ncbi:MAG: HAD hydrolase family protein [Pseudomonadota bacterium]
MTSISGQALNELAAKIELCLFDVDGVLTDGRIVIGTDGQEFKFFDVQDGQGVVMLGEFVELGVITGRESDIVTNRMNQLGITHVYQGQKNKLNAFQALLSKLGLSAESVCYVGDDLPDLAVMTKVGLPIAVANAVPAVKQAALYCTQTSGGRGAVREVSELILSAKGHLETLVARSTDSSGSVDDGKTRA